MVDFLLENQFSAEAKAFIKEAKEGLQDGGEVDFENAYIETLTPDDSYIYNGPKQFIPKELSLSNGEVVSVLFGNTHSDNKSADQKVATHLIDGLKEALGRANEALASADKIKEIYISATTNGNHGITSNHFNGTAMDISRINGNKMALTGVTNQIKELQNAFDDYKYIRENFGPYFKHKYRIENNIWNYNYAVGGIKTISIFQLENKIVMFKRMIFYIVIFVNSSSCMAQKDMITKVENSDLKYLMTYLETSKIQSKMDQDKKFFLKIVEMPGKQKALIDKEETISSSFYYVLVSSFDKASHREAKLYKSKDFVLPKIVEVKESGDKQKFIIELSVVPLPKKSKKFDGKVLLTEDKINQRERNIIQVEKY